MKYVMTKSILIILFCSSTNFFCSDNSNSFTAFLQSEQVKQLKDLTCSAAAKGYQTTSWAVTSTIRYVKNKNKAPMQDYDTSAKACAHNTNYQSNSDSDSDSDSEFSKVTLPGKVFFRDQKELQSNLEADAPKTIHKLNAVTVDYFKKENPENLTTQKDMYHTFSLLQESSTENRQISLDHIIADDHNAQQRKLLLKKIEEHARTIEPELEMVYLAAKTIADNDYNRRITAAKKKHDDATKKADDARLRSLNKSKNTLHTFAFNARYLNNRATKKEDHVAHNLEIFESAESYKNFLDNMRKQQVEINPAQEIAVESGALLKSGKQNNGGGKSKNKKPIID